ncbi:MAG: carboxypeptidase regulatory-like domain-containing protein [Myxococcales bacterium]|nr:MAG: carboxypeptidase regulatory-like domain-containing protein [Myxococcales bacterium]
MAIRWVGIWVAVLLFLAGFGCVEEKTLTFADGDSQEADGDEATDGDATDGDLPDGDFPDGDSTDGDLPDGDEAQCQSLCDCPQGWVCTETQACDDGPFDESPVIYCCTNAGCPGGLPCEYPDGSFGTCPSEPDGDQPDGDMDYDFEGECRFSEDCPPCSTCQNVGGTMMCIGIGDYECMSDFECTLEGYCKPLQATHPECGGTCEVLSVEPYTLHEWGVNLPHLAGGSEVAAGSPRYWGAMPAKPVIYIYADQPMTLDVGVHFASGGTTETWPERPNGPTIWWSDIDVTQGECETTPTPQPGLDEFDPEDREIYQLPAWVVPDADCLSADGVVSKLLFYTGELATYIPPLDAQFVMDESGDSVTFTLANNSDVPLGPVLLLYRNTQGECMDPTFCPVTAADLAWGKVDAIGPGDQAPTVQHLALHHLTSNEEWMPVEIPAGWSGLADELAAELAAAGLYPDEVNVFMNAWRDVFFGLYSNDAFFLQPGYRNGAFVIYLWPDSHTAEMLPLFLDPRPRDVSRAIVQYQQVAGALSEMGSVRGTVNLEEYDGMNPDPVWIGPAVGATVTVIQNDELIAEATVDDQGAYSFTLSPGLYRMSAQRNAWETGDQRGAVQVFARQETIVDFTITTEAMADKPNLYLYPTQTTEVSVTLGLCWTCEVTQSIPEYGQGWQVTVSPDGLIDGQYRYLFYEAEIPHRFPLAEGWAVPAADVAEFFDQTLTAYGFTPAETADFVDYWSVHLPLAPFYAVYPLSAAQILDPLAELFIEPAPDSLFRLWFVISPETSARPLLAPAIAPMTRQGFTAVEWGVVLD